MYVLETPNNTNREISAKKHETSGKVEQLRISCKCGNSSFPGQPENGDTCKRQAEKEAFYHMERMPQNKDQIG